ncbi:MAG TPA: Crp/Fnr family transcriptional regulator [Flavitalea sp.]|nr:Crp/Fnr family transcriptional regulator [Flavitalea sp.]
MWETLIENLSRFIVLSTDEIAIIQSLFTEKKFRKRQYILQEADVSRSETYIVTGLTRTYEVDDKGIEHIMQFGPEDWWVGDLFSFLTETPTRFNVDCLEDTQVLQISKPNLELLYQKVPATERYFRIIIQNAYIASINRISSSLRKTAPQRYQEFIERYPHIEQRVPNHQIASYLGITPQSLSRIRRKTGI